MTRKRNKGYTVVRGNATESKDAGDLWRWWDVTAESSAAHARRGNAIAQTRLYFAYGSNMAHAQMLRRCPDATAVGPAQLDHWRLGFAGRSTRWGGAVATIKRAEGRCAPGVLWEIDARDLEALDRAEGWPFVYERRRMRVRDGQGRFRSAWVYIHRRGSNGSCPDPDYLRLIVTGYRTWSLAVEPMLQAMKQDCGPVGRQLYKEAKRCRLR